MDWENDYLPNQGRPTLKRSGTTLVADGDNLWYSAVQTHVVSTTEEDLESVVEDKTKREERNLLSKEDTTLDNIDSTDVVLRDSTEVKEVGVYIHPFVTHTEVKLSDEELKI